MRTQISRRILSAAAACAALTALPASAQNLYTWPDTSPPCNGTLQACVSAAGPEDGVDIATNGPIDESIHKTGSLDLRAAPGFSPVFAANRQVTASPSLAGGDQFIRIEGLTLTRGEIQVSQVGHPAALTAQILDNTVLAPQASSPIQVLAWDSGPLVFTISGNTLATDQFQDGVVTVSVIRAVASGDVVDNVIAVPSSNDAVGIDLSVGDGALEVDVVGNRIDGAFYHDGIVLNRSGTGVLTARVLGNLVRGASGGAGIAAYGNGYPGWQSGRADREQHRHGELARHPGLRHRLGRREQRHHAQHRDRPLRLCGPRITTICSSETWRTSTP